MSADRRIFVGGLFHEGHSFSNLLTELENFTVVSGDQLAEKARRSASILGGGYRILEQAGAEIVPGFSAMSLPGGPVRDFVYEELRSQIVKAAKAAQPDGVFLELHGAMAVQNLRDPEGDLLETLRSELGSTVPIAVALDLHAHVTPQMLSAVDICLACKKNPHSDYAEAGAKAAELLLSVVNGKKRPVTAAVWLPLLTGHRIETAEGPLAEVHDLRQQAISRHKQILDISIYNTSAYLDAEGAGQCVTVITEGDPKVAGSLSVSLSAALWERRHAFVSDLVPLDEALKRASKEGPLILGDYSNRVLSGAPGDGTYILSKLKSDWPDLRALVPVTDPNAVQAAKSAGVGNTVSVAVGGGYSVGETPFKANWRVIRLGDGKFIQRGPFLAGEPADSGETAVLTSGNITVIASSRPNSTQDPAAFTSNGVNPEEYDVVTVSSGFHFKLSFADIGTCLVVDTPGMSNYRPGLLPYQHRRPCFPEDDIEEPTLLPKLFYRGEKAQSDGGQTESKAMNKTL